MSIDTQHNDKKDEINQNHETLKDDLHKARETIHREHFKPRSTGTRQLWQWLVKSKESFLLSCTMISSLVAVGGLAFAIFQFDRTMKIQRHATAEATVGQFISQVTELVTQETALSNTDEQDNHVLQGFIVSRAQMLIDGEETGRFAGDILRFLAANKFGQLIGRGPGAEDGPTLTVKGLVLVDAKITHATVEGGFLSCMGFERGMFDNVKINGGTFRFIKLNKSQFMSVGFDESKIEAIDFSDTRFSGVNSFKNASLTNVRFSSSQLLRQKLIFEGATIINSDFSEIGTKDSLKAKQGAYSTLQEHERLANYIYLDKLDRSSIENTTIDSALLDELIKVAETKDIAKLEELLAPDKLTDLVHWIELDNLAKQLSEAKSLKGTSFSEPLRIALQRRVNENLNTPNNKSLFSQNLQDELKRRGVKFDSLGSNQTWDWVWKDHCPDEQRRDRRLDDTQNDSSGSLLAFF